VPSLDELAPGQRNIERNFIKPDLLVPNRFGLFIGDDPYRSEFCADPRFLKGGDGGSSWCEGEGHYRIWRSLAIPHRWPVRDPVTGWVRRALILR